MIVHPLIGVVDSILQYLFTPLGRTPDMAEGDDRFLLPHPNPTSPSAPMTRITVGSNDEMEIPLGGERNDELAARREPDEWWKTMLEISTKMKSSKLRKTFFELVNSEREAKDQVRISNLNYLRPHGSALTLRSMQNFFTRKRKSRRRYVLRSLHIIVCGLIPVLIP